jgi:hypothetical protein
VRLSTPTAQLIPPRSDVAQPANQWRNVRPGSADDLVRSFRASVQTVIQKGKADTGVRAPRTINVRSHLERQSARSWRKAANQNGPLRSSFARCAASSVRAYCISFTMERKRIACAQALKRGIKRRIAAEVWHLAEPSLLRRRLVRL